MRVGIDLMVDCSAWQQSAMVPLLNGILISILYGVYTNERVDVPLFLDIYYPLLRVKLRFSVANTVHADKKLCQFNSHFIFDHH